MGVLSRRNSDAGSVDEDTIEFKRESPATTELTDDLSSTRVTAIKDEATSSTSSSPSLLATKIQASRSSSQSTNKSKLPSDINAMRKDNDDTNGHISPKLEPEPPVKQSRAASQKGIPRVAPLFDNLPDASLEATSTFVVMTSCTYANKFLGYTEHAMECDCSEEWDGAVKLNRACGEDSDCINRATKMECVGDCACGSACQNQRFQQKQYADVSVIKTEKKGYGLRTNTELRNGDFIFEYIGEVINEPQFRRRMIHYDEEGIKHFYFMSLSKGEFVDATKKGNLGRFCNHSCNPNCYVDKWVVGDKLRMGIFAERTIKAGEELVFNYNVDRYGANPQPCYCGESNCTGFIGGKTQTERATKLSAATIEALGIEDADTWDTTVAKRPKKKKTGEDDEEYVDSVEAKSLEADGVTKVMAALMQCKEKWIAVKLLQRIQRCDDEVRNRVVKLHGYQILNSQLAAWKEDENVVLQILDILDKFPRLTRNKIVDSKIESTLNPFKDSDDDRVASQASRLLDEWSNLEMAYRIPRKKRDPNEISTPTKAEPVRFERRESANERRRSRSRSRTPPRGPSSSSAPSGPRSSLPQRNYNTYPRGPPPFNRNFAALPRGWFQAQDKSNRTYFYSASGQTTWARPTQPAEQPPPPPKQPSQQDVLKSIIDNIVIAKEKEREAKNTTPDTPKDVEASRKAKKEDKWKSYDEDKKKKIYENTLFPHISHVMNRYKSKIPRDDLKRFAKDIAKKLVNSDFKAGRVNDPTKIDEKHQQKVKKFCKDFFDKAAHKHKKHEEEKAARKIKAGGSKNSTAPTPVSQSQSPSQNGADASPDMELKNEEDSDDQDVKMSEDELDNDTTTSKPANGNSIAKLKRKRSDDDFEIKREDDEDKDLTKSPIKKANMDSFSDSTPPPPPPPAPPAETPPEFATPEESGVDLHDDTSFKRVSMADVLAEAQMDEDEEMDVDPDSSMQEANTRFAEGLETNGIMHRP